MFTYEMRPRRIALIRPLHDGERQRLELLALQRAVQARARPRRVLEPRPRASGRARPSRRRARARLPAARPRAPRRTVASSRAASSSGSVGVPSRRSVPAILPVSTVSPAQSRMSSAIWNAMPSARPNSPSGPPPAEQARGLEQLPRLQRAPLEVRLDGRVRVVRLRALHRLAAREAERRVGEHRHRSRVAGRRQLGEGAREQVVARRARGGRPVARPGRGAAAPELGAVDQVVVDERRHVHELDRDAGLRPAARRPAARSGRRAAAAAACRRRRAPRRPPRRRGRDAPRPPARAAPRARSRYASSPGVSRIVASVRHSAVPMCRATIPPAEQPVLDVAEPRRPQQPGELVRAREAPHARGQVRVGRAARAAPCPSSGTIRSNQSR